MDLGLGEDRLDHALAFWVELAAAVGLEDPAHEVVKPAVPAGAGAATFAGVGWDQNLDALINDALHLDLMPIAGIGDDHLRGDVELRPPRVRSARR